MSTHVDLDTTLDDIDQRCLAAVLAGGSIWASFKADAEQRTGLPWQQIKTLLDERYANGGGAGS